MQQPAVSAPANRGAGAMTGRSGWVAFAAVMTGLTGALNVIDGFTGLYASTYFRDSYVIGNLRTWSFAFIAFGAVQLIAGFAIYAGQGWARWFAIVTIALNAFAQLLSIGSYPFYALAIIGYDLVVLYALTAHWQKRATAT
jgi:hypothetical protein